MRRSPGIGVAISIVSVAGVIWWITRQDAPRLPSSPAEIALAIAAVGVYAVITAARGWRWHRILAHAAIRHARVEAFALTVVGYMGNVVLPARGGEVLRVLLLAARSSARKREVIGSLVTERVFDAGALVVLLVGLTVVGVAGAPYGAIPAVVGAALAFAGAVAVALYVRLRRAGRFDRFATRVRPIARMGRVLLAREGALLAGATLGIWLMEASVLALCSAALGLGLGFVDATFLVVLVSISAMIPAGPGYAGTFDAALLFGLHRLGVQSSDAVGVLLLYRAVIFLPVTVAGLAVLVGRYGGLRTLRRSAAADDEELLAEDPPRERRPEVASGQRA